MTDILKFKHPDKKPTDPLLRSDPIPDYLNQDARLIYLRIIDESEPGVLLQCDRIAVEITAHMVANALLHSGALLQTDGREFIDNIKQAFDGLLAPELGQEYINQILRTG